MPSGIKGFHVPDQGLIPDNIGALTAWFGVAGAAIVLVWRQFGQSVKGSFTGAFNLVKNLVMLSEGHAENKKNIAEHELKIRSLEWVKTEAEQLREKVNDHEGRLRTAEHRQNEDEVIREQFRLNLDGVQKSVNSLNHDSKLQSMQLNQILTDNGVTNEQLRGMNQRLEMVVDQIQMLIQISLENNKK